MRRPPAPSSARLSTEAGGGFPAHGLAPDQPSPLLPTPNPVPGPVPEGFMDEHPPHPDPASGPVPEGFMDERPPHPDPVPSPVPECSEDELPPPLVPVPEEFVDELSPLPVSVPEGCEDTPSPPTVPLRLRRRSPWACRSDFRTAPLSSTVGSPDSVIGRLIVFSYFASLLITCPYVAGLLITGSAWDGLRASRLNSLELFSDFSSLVSQEYLNAACAPVGKIP
ncbi:hypothetical protein CRENBAI_011798 [Crenichthys baileyi]|uniref:Uncharacterized protein n=1 Tax=Crenichthys baileyi TaxID=28760 RepID=A0AAV9SN65_9TELE